MGIEPGFGSFTFGIFVIQFSDGVLQVLYEDEFERPKYEEMPHKIANLYHEFTNIKNIFVDAANPELISSLKREVAYVV
jgi:Holliday junction resolvasome RuvABC endonuclease subunit